MIYPMNEYDNVYIQTVKKHGSLYTHTYSHSHNNCCHKQGYYRIIPYFFGLFIKQIYICKSCNTVLYGKKLKRWEKENDVK